MRSELIEIRQLFEKAEYERDPERKHAFLEEVLNLADDFATENPASPDLLVVQNLRRAHLHRLLEQLSLFGRNIEIGAWFNYLKLFLLRVEPEVKQVLEGDPALKDSYRKFLDIWRSELLEALGQLQGNK